MSSYTLQYAVRGRLGEMPVVTTETFPSYGAAERALGALFSSLFWWAEIVDEQGQVLDSRTP